MKFKKVLTAILIVSLIVATSAGCKKEEIIAGSAAAGTVLGGLGTLLGAFTSNSTPATSPSTSNDVEIENDSAAETKNGGG